MAIYKCPKCRKFLVRSKKAVKVTNAYCESHRENVELVLVSNEELVKYLNSFIDRANVINNKVEHVLFNMLAEEDWDDYDYKLNRYSFNDVVEYSDDLLERLFRDLGLFK